jgi:YrhK-like protein
VTAEMRLAARLCWAIDERRWMLTAADVAAASLFVFGSAAFYRPALHAAAITLFLGGSVLILLSALGEAIVRHGPSV